MPSSPSTKKANVGPGYYDLIKEAVISLKERTGSSRHAIDKYVAAKKGANYSKSRLNIALKRGVESGKLVPVKGSFKLAAEEKKGELIKKPIAKPVAEKTAAPAKKAKQFAAKNTTSKITKMAVKKAVKSAAKKITKKAKKPVTKKTLAKKVLIKKPKTTKKKVVKKSLAKKTKPASK